MSQGILQSPGIGQGLQNAVFRDSIGALASAPRIEPKLPRADFRDPITGQVTAASMLQMRLEFMHGRGHRMVFSPDGKQGFRIASVEELDAEVIVFGIHDGKPVTLTDEREMFPSDKLIAKIKLLTA